MSGKKPPPKREEGAIAPGDKLATSREIYHRVRWDPRIDHSAYTIGYEDREEGMQEIAFAEFTPDGDIPWHRVWLFRKGGQTMWDRKARIDRISEAAPALAAGYQGAEDDAPTPALLVEPEIGEVSDLPSYRFDASVGRWAMVMALDEAPAGESAAPSSSSAASLRIATFNVLSDLHEPEKLQSERRRPAVLALLRDCAADVLALQEVTPSFLRALLDEPWVRRGYFASDLPRGDTVMPSGELLLSRWPIERLQRHRFSERKTALVAELLVAGRPLRAAVVHLSSNRASGARERRAAQLWTLLDALAAPRQDDAARDAVSVRSPDATDSAGEERSVDAVVLGDFNAGEHELDELTAAYAFTDAWRSRNPGAPGFTYDPETNALARLTSQSGNRSRYDRLLCRGARGRLASLEARLLGTAPIADGLFASDHYALLCTLSLEEAPTHAGPLSGLPDSSATDVGAGGEASGLATPYTHHSALVLIPPASIWPPIQAIRAKHDKSYRRFMPHLTLLYGFLPEEHFAAAAARIQPVARRCSPFTVKLGALATFVHRGSQTVWSQPSCEPVDALRELQAALEAAFPQCDEQSTRSGAGYTPHLTVAQLSNPRDDEQRAAHAALLASWRRTWHPLSFSAGEIALISRRGDEPFEVRYRVALGSGEIVATDKATLTSSAASPSGSGSGSGSGSDSDSAISERRVSALALLRDACAAALASSATPPLPSDALLHLFGSARLGTLRDDSDLDVFCAGTTSFSSSDFFSRVATALTATGQLTSCRAIPTALVPILQLALADVDFDLSYVALPDAALDEARAFLAAGVAPVELPALWSASQASGAIDLDAPSQLVLLGAADADELLRRARVYSPSTGESLYRQVVFFLNRWARRRGLHGNALGFLGGFSWAVLAAWAIETAPPHAITPERLIIHLFASLASWDFDQPIALAGTAEHYQSSRHREPLVLLAPAAPVRNTARNVTRATLAVLRDEFRALHDFITERDAIDPRPFTPGPPYTHALTLSLRCADQDLASCRGFLDSQLLSLLLALEPLHRLRPHAPPHLPAELRVYLSDVKDPRRARSAAKRLVEKFASWPDRPAGAELVADLSPF